MEKGAVSISKLVRDIVNDLKLGEVFTLDNFLNVGSRAAVATTLSRLVSEGIITRIRRGLYMIPKESRFGSLPPNSDSVVRVLSKQGRRSYAAGATAANKLGLTTQVPNTIVLTGGGADVVIEIGSIKIKIKAGKSPAKKSDIPLMMLLDLIRGIKKIPGSTLVEAISILKFRVDQLTKNEKVRLVTLATKDKPMVKAILGAILDELNPELSGSLYETLNPLTSYKVGETGLKFSSKWRIK